MAVVDQQPTPYTGFDRMLMDGEWRRGSTGDTFTDTNPYSGSTLTEIQLASADDVDTAYRAAQRAQRDWAAAPAQERSEVLLRAAEIMRQRQEEIVGWLIAEAGGTRPRAEFECQLVRSFTLEAASYPTRMSGRILTSGIPGKENRVYRKPAGVVCVISPWNFPLQLSNRSVSPALALGNAVVLKPASDTPVTGALLLAKIFEEAGLPPGVLNVVIGRGREVGSALHTHPVPSVVSFTGSTEVGKGIAQQAGLKRLALELGGNGPLVVLDDANIEQAVQAALHGSFVHQGQVCMATNRIIVDRSVQDKFTELLVQRARELRTGDPAYPETQIGPVINRTQLESIQDKISRAEQDGADVLVSGEPEGPAGLVLPPHVVLGNNRSATAREEVFGPVATIIPADDAEHALQLANDTEYGLSSAVFTGNLERGVRFASRIEAGMTHVNDTTVNDEPNIAFGGEKDSGMGRFGGEWAIDEFTTDHWISVQHQPRDLPL